MNAILRTSCVLVLLCLAAAARADCEPGTSTPSLGDISYTIHPTTRELTATVSYSFPGTTSASQRLLTYSIGSLTGTHSPASASGTWTFTFGVACWGTGDHHRLKVTAVSCGQSADPQFRDETEVAIPVDSTPRLTSLSLTPNPATGLVAVRVDYDFPNTVSSSQRTLRWYVNGVQKGQTSPGSRSGTWQFDIGIGCWGTGTHNQLKVAAFSCGNFTDVRFRDEEVAQIPTDSTPRLSGLTVTPNPSTSTATASVDYVFPNTVSSSQRLLRFYINDTLYSPSLSPSSYSGRWTFSFSTACWATGDYHRLKVVAYSCGNTTDARFRAEASTGVPIDSTPRLTNVDVPVNETGVGSIEADFEFPHTTSAAQRSLQYSIDNGPWQSVSQSLAMTGHWSQPLDTSCWSNGSHVLKVKVESCGPTTDTRFRREETATIEVNHTPTVSIAIRKAPGGSHQAVVTYAFPQTTSPAQRSLQLKWLPSGTTIQTLAAELEGEWVVNVPDCEVGARESVQVIATACNSTTDRAEAKLPDCETSCSIECPDCAGDPIRVTSGNMRLDDAEPLPAGDLDALHRTYDSKGTAGVFGNGWTSIFDARATIAGGTDNRETVYLVTESGDRYFFVRNGAGNSYRQLSPAGERRPTLLTYDAARAVFLHRGGASSKVRVFRASDGRLAAVRRVSHMDETTIGYDSNGRPTAVQDGHGRWAWTLTTNAAGRIENIAVDGQPQLTWTYAYDGGGNLRTVSNVSGTWRTYTYGPAGMEEARDGNGRLLEAHQYDAAGNAISSIGPSGSFPSIEFDLPGRVEGETVTRVTAAGGRTTDYYSRYIAGKMRTVQVDGSCNCGSEDSVFVYDAEGRIVREQNARGYVTTRIFNETRVIEEIAALRPLACDPATDAAQCRMSPDELETVMLTATGATSSTSYTYTDPNWPDRATAVFTSSILNPAEQKRQEFVYDATTGEVLVQRTIGWTGDTPVQQTRTMTTSLYDGAEAAAFDAGGAFSAWAQLPQPRGSRKSVDGPRTDVNDATAFVHYPHDPSVPALLRGHLAAVRDASGHITRYESYNVFGSPTRIVDANGVATEMTYDILGRLLTTTTRAVTGCDTAADPLCGEDVTTRRTYSGNGPLAVEERPRGGVTVYSYDDRGRILTVSRGPAATDLRERSEGVYDPVTGEKTLERLLAFESGSWVEKQRQSSVYDAAGRMTRAVNADGTFLEYAYQPGGLVASVRDENHTSPNTFYEYDPAGHLTRVRQTLGSGQIATSYAYDRDGNLISVTDPNGNVTAYLYDDFGQMLEQTSAVSGVTRYEYDLAGNLVGVTDANQAATVRTYDASNRVTVAVSSRAGLPGETVTWSYGGTAATPFSRNRLSSMTDPTGSTEYEYDRRGLLARERKTIGSSMYTTSFQYDEDGNRSAIAYPSGRVAAYTHDYAGRALSLTSAGTPIVSSASYLPFGPARQIVFGNGTTQTFTRDARYRPLRNALAAAAPLADYEYGHDAAGNITRIDDLVDPGYNRTFGYDDLSRLVTANGGSYTYDAMGNLLASPTATFTMVGTTPKIAAVTENGTQRVVTYDAAGNETATYTHSARNHVIANGTTGYVYDGRGIRTITSNAGQHRYSLYTPELNLLAETELTAASSPAVAWEYLWFAGHPAAQIAPSTGTISWYFTDHLGTPILQTNATAGITWRAEYAPYGTLTTLRTGASHHQPLRFPGQESDGVDEEAYNVFRWYRAGWGRYTQADPAEFEGGLNLYAYALGNPLLRFDPDGLTSYRGFPSDKEKQLRDAVEKAKEALKKNCCDDAKDVLNRLEKAEFVYVDKDEDWCGYVGPNDWLKHRIKISRTAFDPSNPCYGCPLPSIVVHEGVHLRRRGMGDGSAYKRQRQCFGCPPEGPRYPE